MRDLVLTDGKMAGKKHTAAVDDDVCVVSLKVHSYSGPDTTFMTLNRVNSIITDIYYIIIGKDVIEDGDRGTKLPTTISLDR